VRNWSSALSVELNEGATRVIVNPGSMDRGTPSLNIIVVPDSGTGDLARLGGSMNIIIADGKHSYEFEYEL